MEVKVSIIIPVYNVEPWLRDCLDSAVNQTLKEIEIICINDASVDDSLNILEEYAEKDERLQIVNLEINKGLSVARNIGFSHAIGEYVYFFDSDDIIELCAMEKLYNRATVEQLDVLCFEGETFFDRDELSKRYDYQRRWCQRSKEYMGIKTGKELFSEMITNGDYKVVVWILFVRRAFYIANKLEFVPQILFEDNIFTFELFLRANRVAHLYEKLYLRRVRDNSITTSKFAFARVWGFFTCVLKCIDFVNELLGEDETKKLFYKEVDRLLWCCRNEYKNLSVNETDKYLQLPVEKSRLFKYLVVDYVNLEKEKVSLGNRIKQLDIKYKNLFDKFLLFQKENSYNTIHLRDVKSGWSFRIGRIITFIPRNIRDFLRHKKFIK